MEESQVDYSGINLTPQPPPPPITLEDLINSVEALTKKESEDKTLLESIENMPSEDFKTKLISWAVAGFPNVYEIHRVVIVPPQKCSDGVSRGLADYIEFCSGKTINQHVEKLQEKVTGISLSFANMGTYIAIVVSKA
jgi:hypothetical protein